MTSPLKVISAKGNWVKCDAKLIGKTVVITGANTGIGYETAKDLSKRGAKIIMGCRNFEKANEAKEKIAKEVPKALLEVRKLDLASLNSVREFAKSINESEEHLDILINNAGVMVCPQSQTEDGFETQLGVNHIGHFLLTNLLLDLIKKSAPSRIVILSSSGHLKGEMRWDDLMRDKEYKPWDVYFQSKLANVLHMQSLCTRLQGTGVTCNSVHPGIVKTELGRHMFNSASWLSSIKYAIVWPFLTIFLKTPVHGAQTSIYCAVAPELDEISGLYFSDCAPEELLPKAKNMEDAERLWKLSEEWVAEK